MTRRPEARDPQAGADSELEHLRATCRRQAHVIEALSDAVSTLRSGAAELKAENAGLRAENDRIHDAGRARARASGTDELDARVPLDVRAPAAARGFVATCLRDRVARSVLECAQLLVSELVTNSVRHSGAGDADVVVVRVAFAVETIRLDVEDPGRDGVIAPRSPDAENGGSFGLNLVQALCERWGLERVAAGGTRVWVQIATHDAPAARKPHVVHKPDEGKAAHG